MQQILSTQFLETDHLIYFLTDDGIAELISKGAEINPKLLSTQIYYIPEDLISSCANLIETIDDPIAIGTQVLTEIIIALKIERTDNFEELLNQIDKFQRYKFNLLIEDNQQKPLNLVHLISQQSKVRDDELRLDNIRDDILTKINQIHFSVHYF